MRHSYSGLFWRSKSFGKLAEPPKKTVLIEIFHENPQELVKDLKFSREGDYLRISSRRGDALRHVFIPPGIECEEPSLKFREDNLMQQNEPVDNLIANLEKRDNRESQILFEGHFKKPANTVYLG